MKKKIIFSMFTVLLCSSCQKEESKTITFMIPNWGAPTQSMLEQFKKDTGITVNVNTVSWDDIRNKVSIAATGKKAAADVFEVDWSWIGEFHSAGWLNTIALNDETIQDIPSLSTFTIDKKIYAVPYANDFRTAYYNKKIYDSSNLLPPKTWNDIKQQMTYLKENNILKYPYTLPLNATEGTTTAFIWITFLRDGVVFNQDGTLNKENAMNTLNFIDYCVKNKLINPVNLTSKDIDTYRQLLSGESAYMIGPTSFVSRAYDSNQSKVVGDIDVILPPGNNTTSSVTMALTEAIGVSAFSKNKDAANRFVKWYSSKEIQKELYKTLSTTPTRTSVLKKLIDDGAIKNAGAMMETAKLVKSPFPNGVPNFYSEMSNTISNSINQMATGNITPEKAFDQMNDKINQLLKENK